MIASASLYTPGAHPPHAAWYALWTRTRAEQVAADDLAARGFTTFLPKVPTWTRRGQARRRLEQPLFPGYLFVRHSMDHASHVEILKARGVVRVLGDGPAALSAIPTDEIDAVRRIIETGTPMFRDRPLADGDRVRIIGGPLEGLYGWFRQARPDKGLFLVSIALLQRTVSVEIDGTLVEAA